MSDGNRPAYGPAPASGHHLPPRFSGGTGPIVQRRSAPKTLLFGILGAAVVVGAFTAVHIGANLRFDDAADAYQSARTETVAARTALESEVDALTATTTSADSLLAADTGLLMDGVPLDDLTTAITDAKDLTATAQELTAQEPPRLGEKPGWFWELFGSADLLDAQADDADALRTELDAQLPEVEEADAAMIDAGSTVVTGAAAAVPAFEAGHISAKNLDIIAMRTAADDIAPLTTLDDDAVARFTTLQASAAQVVASEDAEMAEKAGPLLGARLEIEAFARSLAPGVLLEFDWAPIVNGAGDNGSMGGYTTWWWDEPDRSVILLSNSVAEQWPADRSKALVAHEVGHAISVKCEDMYDSSTQDSIEKWATAWAISMGFTDDANGVWAYGYPPESYIAAASGCR
ncbi:hypothetical protein ACFY9N_10000 [Microbacterium sp. NPDC008134]|uniref:hypothetical protein n=1 Tax=Microbacterium sp. NPDC008134 TaxID=3364183 RepID=UPI0036E80910